jgi:hypothetical protein
MFDNISPAEEYSVSLSKILAYIKTEEFKNKSIFLKFHEKKYNEIIEFYKTSKADELNADQAAIIYLIFILEKDFINSNTLNIGLLKHENSAIYESIKAVILFLHDKSRKIDDKKIKDIVSFLHGDFPKKILSNECIRSISLAVCAEFEMRKLDQQDRQPYQEIISGAFEGLANTKTHTVSKVKEKLVFLKDKYFKPIIENNEKAKLIHKIENKIKKLQPAPLFSFRAYSNIRLFVSQQQMDQKIDILIKIKEVIIKEYCDNSKKLQEISKLKKNHKEYDAAFFTHETEELVQECEKYLGADLNKKENYSHKFQDAATPQYAPSPFDLLRTCLLPFFGP